MVWIATGLVVVELEGSGPGRLETDSVRWFEAARSSGWTDVAHLASRPADTFVVIGLIGAAAVGSVLVMRQLRPWAFLATTMLIEVLVALTSSMLVARPRPPVEQLATPPTDSWPSGHVAAATAFYFAVALILSVRFGNRYRWVRPLVFGAAALVVSCVALSRLYLGAHYPSDIVAGALLGFAALAVARRVVGHDTEIIAPGQDDERLTTSGTPTEISRSVPSRPQR